MSRLLNLVTPLHQQTKRDYLARMVDDKVNCMLKAKEYGFDYWDGDRRYGYGGYHYDGRWKVVAEQLVETYGLKKNAGILDVGCGKGFLLYEIQKLLPEATLYGIDISKYGLKYIPAELNAKFYPIEAQTENYPFENNEIDLVVSLGCLHNLKLSGIEIALSEFERVGKNKYVMVESYRTEQEQFNLQCWALTAEIILDSESWEYLFGLFGYTGDYEFIYFE